MLLEKQKAKSDQVSGRHEETFDVLASIVDGDCSPDREDCVSQSFCRLFITVAIFQLEGDELNVVE